MVVRRISDKGETARKLIQQTPSIMKFNGKYVHPTKCRVTKKNGVTHYSTTTRTSESGQKPRLHHQSIFVLNKDKISDAESRIIFDCDCDAHWAYCEVALYRVGSANILRSNGKKPVVTNPRMIPFLCKHGCVVIDKLIRAGK